MTPASIRVKAVDGILCPVPRLYGNVCRYVGRPNGAGLEATLPFEEIPSKPRDVFQEIVRHVRFGDLEPADEPTAVYCGVKFKAAAKPASTKGST